MKMVWFGILVVGLVSFAGVHSQQNSCPGTGMGPYDYKQALCMSFLFYEAQRSGLLPPDQRVTWRGDSALSDGFDNSVDLLGGYYDAGDFVKFGYPLASTLTFLSWGLIAYPNGYSAAGQTDYARKAIKWGTDYLLKAKTGPTEFYGQVGDGDIDHNIWGRPEGMTMARPSAKIDASNPGSDLAAESAAALAAASIVFANVDPCYSSKCLSAARELFSFADEYRGFYHDSIQDAEQFYKSYSYEDELAWSALWMYKATNENHYLEKANSFISEFGILYYALAFNWDGKQPGIYALAAELDGRQEYKDALTNYVNKMMNVQQHTPKGLVFVSEWGTLRDAMGPAFIAARAASLNLNPTNSRLWAQQQIDYALGSTGRSFVCGFGVNPPKHPHHKSSSCPNPPASCGWDQLSSPDPNPHTLYGALVGGPDINDYYTDDRTDYVMNEVSCDYNALFTSLLAAMVELH